MARRLDKFVLRGAIRNGNRNNVSGWLEVMRSESYDGSESVEPGLHPNLAATGFVKHYCSSDQCEECDAEFE